MVVTRNGVSIELLLFDLDGTLYDERGGMVRALGETLELAGRRLPGLDRDRAAALYPEVGRRVWEAADLGVVGGEGAVSSQQVRQRVWTGVLEALGFRVDGLPEDLAACYASARARAHSLFEESLAVLEETGRHVRLGLVTNGPSDLQRDKIDACGLTSRFDPIVISAEVGVAKPDRRIFLDTVAACGVPPERALHVGDNPVADVAGARAAGLRAVWVNRRGETFPPELPRPDHVMSDLTALPGLLALSGKGPA